MAKDGIVLITVSSEPADNAPTGKIYIWVTSNGHIWTKTDTGVTLDHGATGPTIHNDLTGRSVIDSHPTSAITGLDTSLSSKIPKSDFTAKGQILTATASGTYTALPVGTNGKVLQADSTTASGMAWNTPRASNTYKYDIKTTNYTLDIINESFILFGNTTPVMLTIPLANTLPNDGYAREFGAHNLGSSTVTISLSGSDNFNNGINKVQLNPGEFIRFGGAYPVVGGGWLLLHIPPANTQLRRSDAWTSGNFSSLTAVPFTVVDEIHDPNRINANIVTNPTRVTVYKTGQYAVSTHGNINSTGGSSYSIVGYIRKNGTTKIDGTDFAFGNYQNEDTFFAVPPVVTTLSVNDYIEILLDQNNLTGQAEEIVLAVEER